MTDQTAQNVKQLPNVPVIMYHSVVDANDNRLFPQLSCPVAVFESHLQALRQAKFHTISLQTLYEYMAYGRAVPERSVVLTFDDGYLDNWVFAYPLLKKYGFQGTIFVNPDFVDPAETPRPTLEDVWNKKIASADDLPKTGFLSWAEMREMERTGVIDIQSHGLTHTWYFCSDEIIDFYHPNNSSYFWLAWNARPKRKYLWMSEEQQNFVPWGKPIYQYEKSLGTRRYFQDKNLDERLTDYVKTRGDESFFTRPDWRKQLSQLVKDYRSKHGNQGRLETDDEYRARLHRELHVSKKIIGERLNKSVNFLCWPGGGYNQTSVQISQEVGYLASTLSSRHRGKKNMFGQDPSRLGRISPPMFIWDETEAKYNGGFHLICQLKMAQGSKLCTYLYKLLRLPFKLSQWLAVSR